MKPTLLLIPFLCSMSAMQARTPAAAAPGAAEGFTVDQTVAEKSDRNETAAQRNERMHWWREAKFGLFIHWGVYAVPAGQYGDKTDFGEWIMQSMSIPVAEYRGYARQFNPVKYDPAFWASLAKDAGMRYIVITAKHHDGFALYPSKASAWNVADATPYKKDLLGPLVAAARHEGLKIGFYYSQSQDWVNPGGSKHDLPEGSGWDPAQFGDFDHYLQTVALPQTEELLSAYQPDILWWDTAMAMTPARAKPFHDHVASQPHLITNNRLGGGYPGDTSTPEGYVPATGLKGDWEVCMTMNRHWGYNAADQDWKSSTDLIRKLADICAKGGNFLLNVGPTAEGEIPAASIERLRDMGRWLRVNGDSIYGTTAGGFPFIPWGVVTRKGDRLFLHVFHWPAKGELRVPMLSAVKSARLLADPEAALTVRQEKNHVVVQVPAQAPDVADSVIELALGADLQIVPIPSVGKQVSVSSAQPGSPAENLIDGTARNWTATESKGWAQIDLGAPMEIGAYAFDEPDVWPRLKQTYRLEVEVNGAWQTIAEGKTVGHGHTETIPPVVAQRFRLSIDGGDKSATVAEWQLYHP